MSSCSPSCFHISATITKPSSAHHCSPSKKPHAAVSLLQLCRTHDELSQVHALLVKTALIRERHAFGRLLLSLASLHRHPDALAHASQLFEGPECPRNAFAYNTMIKFYSRTGDVEAAFSLLSEMLRGDCLSAPDGFTYTFLLNACARLSLAFEGRQIHAQLVKNAGRVSTNSWNALMDFYVKAREDLRLVRTILDGMFEPNVVSWNTLLDGYVKWGSLESAQGLFDEMPNRDTVSWTTMLVGYANAGLVAEARRLFDEMPERNVVSWSAIIGCYVRFGLHEEALALSVEMQSSKNTIDMITLTILLSACAGLGTLDRGRCVHSYIERHAVELDAQLCTALVDMYGKCGRIDMAKMIFRICSDKKVFLWNAMLGALAMHSCGKEALDLFSEMLDAGVEPNEITFICLLSACSHSGLVSDGLRIFHSMARYHNVQPNVEHFGCLVDLLGRAGLLDKAKQVIEMMPMPADGNVWRALLGACRVHGNVELAEHVGQILLDLEPLNDGNYILLSNIYANKTSWKEVSKLRSIMREKGVRKTPGCSSIEVDGSLHLFFSKDQSHPQIMEIQKVIHELTEICSDDEGILHDACNFLLLQQCVHALNSLE